MKSPRKSIVVLSLLTLCGCSTTVSVPRTLPPANLTSPCEPIQSLTAKDLGELVIAFSELTETYGSCAAKQRALAKWAAGDQKESAR